MKISHFFLIILTPISLVTVQCNALFKEVGQAVETTTETAADVARDTVQTAGDVIPRTRRTPTPYLGTAQRRIRKNVEQKTAQETVQTPQEEDTYIEAGQRVPYFQTARARYREETRQRRAAKKRYRMGGWRKDIDANQYNWDGPVTREPHNNTRNSY